MQEVTVFSIKDVGSTNQTPQKNLSVAQAEDELDSFKMRGKERGDIHSCSGTTYV